MQDFIIFPTDQELHNEIKFLEPPSQALINKIFHQKDLTELGWLFYDTLLSSLDCVFELFPIAKQEWLDIKIGLTSSVQ